MMHLIVVAHGIAAVVMVYYHFDLIAKRKAELAAQKHSKRWAKFSKDLTKMHMSMVTFNNALKNYKTMNNLYMGLSRSQAEDIARLKRDAEFLDAEFSVEWHKDDYWS